MLGFIVSGCDGDVACLRGIEKAAQHSVVLILRDGVDGAVTERLGCEAQRRRGLWLPVHMIFVLLIGAPAK